MSYDPAPPRKVKHRGLVNGQRIQQDSLGCHPSCGAGVTSSSSAQASKTPTADRRTARLDVSLRSKNTHKNRVGFAGLHEAHMLYAITHRTAEIRSFASPRDLETFPSPSSYAFRQRRREREKKIKNGGGADFVHTPLSNAVICARRYVETL